MNGKRSGFSLLEVIAAIAVLSILAAAVLPSTVAYKRKQDAIATAVIFQNLATSIAAMKASTVTFYPFRISHLGSMIKSTDTTSCSGIGTATPTTLYGTKATPWGNTGAGPFYSRVIPTTGLRTPLGTIIDTLYRTVPQKTAGFLPLIIRNLPVEDAEEINSYIDGDADNGDGSNTLGKVIWGVPVSGYVDLKYNVSNNATTC